VEGRERVGHVDSERLDLDVRKLLFDRPSAEQLVELCRKVARYLPHRRSPAQFRSQHVDRHTLCTEGISKL
jgi:hypothetical protein